MTNSLQRQLSFINFVMMEGKVTCFCYGQLRVPMCLLGEYSIFAGEVASSNNETMVVVVVMMMIKNHAFLLLGKVFNSGQTQASGKCSPLVASHLQCKIISPHDIFFP